MTASSLRAAERELETAERALQRMQASNSLEEFEDEWRVYLGAIEKSWAKVERACQEFKNQFQPWQGSYKQLRKSDPLLKYLYHARHSDQHSIQEFVENKQPEYTMSIGQIIPGPPTKMTDPFGNSITFQAGRPSKIKHTSLPQRIELLPVLNSKRWYQPPVKHLDQVIEWPAPVTVAEIGLGFYRTYLNKANERFFRKL